MPETSISVNATAVLPNSSLTTFLSQSLSSPGFTSAPVLNARIILGANGCQTLYSISTTQICSTVITRGGQLPITVSSCSQMVTFSSRSTIAAPICDCPNVAACSTAPTSPASQIVSRTLISEGVSPVVIAGGGSNAGPGMAFFVAPWHEIAAGVVPGSVHVANCADESTKSCTTSSGSWSVSTSTSTTMSMRTVQYAGVSPTCQKPNTSANHL